MFKRTETADNFLSEIYNIECFSFNNHKKNLKNRIQNLKNYFITYKIEKKLFLNFKKELKKIPSCKYIDTEQQYLGKLKKEISYSDCYDAKITNLKSILSIASQELITNRFFLDKRLDKKKTRTLKKKWISNFFKKKRANYLVVKKYSKKIVGFLLVIKKRNNLIVDLIGVKKEHKGKSIGLEMICYAKKKYFKQNTKIIAGTIKTNMIARKFYKKIGLKLFKEKYIYHQISYEK